MLVRNYSYEKCMTKNFDSDKDDKCGGKTYW